MEDLRTVEGRLDARLRWAEEVWSVTYMTSAVTDLDSRVREYRSNAESQIRAYLRLLAGLERAASRNRMSASQCERFQKLAAAASPLLNDLVARGYHVRPSILDASRTAERSGE